MNGNTNKIIIMKDLFVPYNIAVLAKEKGFDEECIRFYGDDKKMYLDDDIRNSTVNSLYCAAPLYQQLVDWFELIGIVIGKTPRTSGKHFYTIWKWDGEKLAWFQYKDTGLCKDTEIPLDVAIIEAFKLT